MEKQKELNEFSTVRHHKIERRGLGGVSMNDNDEWRAFFFGIFLGVLLGALFVSGIFIFGGIV